MPIRAILVPRPFVKVLLSFLAGLVELYTVFLVKNLVKNLAKNLAKNCQENQHFRDCFVLEPPAPQKMPNDY